MLKIYRSYQNPLLLALTVYFLITSLSGCSDFTEEIQETDELNQTLIKAKQENKVEIPLFQLRADIIGVSLEKFETHYPKTKSKELNDLLTSYAVLQKKYDKYINDYNINVRDYTDLQNKIAILSEDLKNKTLTTSEFKFQFKKRKMEVEKLITSYVQVKKSLNDTEPEFQKITNSLEPYKAERISH